MKFLKSSRLFLALSLLAIILIIAAVLRFININSLPIFVDEAIYIRWAQVMRAEPTLRFLPMSDGKQPLFMWAVMPMLKIFSDPLMAGRILSGLSGLGIIVGVFSLSVVLFDSKKVGLLATIFYAVSPYGVFFDRLALVDSMLALWGVWTAVFSILLAKTRRLDTAMITGFLLGAGMITKSPAIFFFLLLPFSLLFINPDKKLKKLSVIYTLGLFTLSGFIGFVIFNLLRLGPNFHLIFSRNLDYVHPYTRIFTSPTDPFVSNIKEYLEWVTYFGPYPIYFLLLISLLNLKKQFRKYILLAAWAFGPIIVQSEYSIAFTARYVLFTIPFLIVIAASSVLSNKKYTFFVYVFSIWFVTLGLYRNAILISNPESANLPQGERSGYLEDWTAGQGIKESAEVIKNIRNESPEDQILVATEGYFGTLPDGLQIYLEKEPNISVIGTGLDFKKVPDQIVSHKAAGGRSFFAVNSSRLELKGDFSDYGLKLLLSVKKPNRTPGTHGYVNDGPFDNYYLFELVDTDPQSDIVLPQ